MSPRSAIKSLLDRYHAKRDFKLTQEPKGKVARQNAGDLRYLIQKHDASRLHYDFRLELDGTLNGVQGAGELREVFRCSYGRDAERDAGQESHFEKRGTHRNDGDCGNRLVHPTFFVGFVHGTGSLFGRERCLSVT